MDPERAEGAGAQHASKVNKNVIVREREFKSERTHKDKVTAIVKLNANEFLTASRDESIKVWDKYLQGVSYTYECKGALQTANNTGETNKEKGKDKDLLIVGLGDGHFVVYGLIDKNECKIETWAHAQPIISIVSMGGYLKNKYFATRCSDGHVNIWSSTNKPEKIFPIWNIDGDHDALAHLQPVPEEPEPVEEKKKRVNEDGEEIEDEEAEEEAPAEDAEDEENAKKKKKEAEPPVAPILIGRPEPSERDTMIEFKWKGLINQSSSMLCISNFNEKLILICNVDIKSRSRDIKKTIKTQNRPTFLYQINEDYLIVGTDVGKLELWNIEESDEPRKVYDAHVGSEFGISSIIQLVEPSELITNERSSSSAEGGSDYIVTAAGDVHAFKIWKILRDGPDVELSMHIKIETTLTQGIRFVLQTSPTQIVCVDAGNTLKFYDFVDKASQKEKEDFQKQTQVFAQLVAEAFNEADEDGSGFLDVEEVKPMCMSLIEKFGQVKATDEDPEVLLDKMFNWLDADNSGRVTFHEFKVQMMRAFIKRCLPEELTA